MSLKAALRKRACIHRHSHSHLLDVSECRSDIMSHRLAHAISELRNIKIFTELECGTFKICFMEEWFYYGWTYIYSPANWRKVRAVSAVGACSVLDAYNVKEQ